jgi:hypothetical protein
MLDTAHHRLAASALALAALAACSGDTSDSPANADVGGADAGADATADSGDGGIPDPSPSPADIAGAEELMPTPDIEGSRLLSDLTDGELQYVCNARRRWEMDFSMPHRRFLCVADAVDATFPLVGRAPDPAFTCSRLSDPCNQILDLEEQFAAMGLGINDEFDDSEEANASCIFDFAYRRTVNCADWTLGEYKACVVRNAAIEQTVLDRASLTCADGIAMGTLRPSTMWNCECGIPAQLGFPPEDDLDWDFVPDDIDVCPDTEREYRVEATGCNRYQDSDFDGHFDPDDLCLGTELDAVTNDLGCSQAQDTDLDRIPNLDDPCPDTETGAELVSYGCSLAQDEDADGVPNPADWCPFTEAGAEDLGTNGCAAKQGEPWNEPWVNELPAGLDTITLGPLEDETAQLRFHVLPSGTSNKVAGDVDYSGTMLLEVGPENFLQMPGTNVRFGDYDPDTRRARALTGTLPFFFPNTGTLQFFRSEAAGQCEVIFGLGLTEEIQALNLPTLAERPYLALDCAVEFQAAFGPMRWSPVDERRLLIAIDPLDPAIMLRANIDDLGIVKYIRDVTVGLSGGKRFRYEPLVNWRVEDRLGGFDAGLYGAGEAPIDTFLPSELVGITVNGDIFVDVDPLGDGVGDDIRTDLLVGVNGAVTATLTIEPSFPISLNQSEASAVLHNVQGDRHAWISGGLGPNSVRFPGLLPISDPSSGRATLFVSENRAESFLAIEGQSTVRGSELSLPLIPDMLDFGIYGSVVIDREGLHVEGTVSGAIHEWVSTSGEATIKVEISPNLRNFSFELIGTIVFKDTIRVSNIYFGSDDIRVDGRSYLPFSFF